MEKNELPCWATLAIVAGLALIGVFIWQLPEKSSEWAAWVQAFGSIAAILGAFWIAESQRSDASRREEISHRRNQAAEASLLESLAAEAFLEVSNLMLYCEKHKDNDLFVFSGEKLQNVEFLLRGFVATSRDPSLSLIAVSLLQDTSDAISTVNWCAGKSVRFPSVTIEHHRNRTNRVQSQLSAAQTLSQDRNEKLPVSSAELIAIDVASRRVSQILKSIGKANIATVETKAGDRRNAE